MRTRRSIAAAAILFVFSAMGAAEDAFAPLRTGDRIRYRLSERDPLITARVVEIAEGSLLLDAGKDRGPLRVDLASLARLDVARGRRSHVRLGAILGGGAGGAVGGFFGFLAASLDENGSSHPAEGALLGAAIVGGAGALVGAAIGSAFRTDRWQRLRDQKVQLALAPVPGRGFAGAVVVRF